MEEKKLIFASNLIRLRTEAHLTQAELAERINYSDKSVSKWERADAMPAPAVIESIAAALGVSPGDLTEPHGGWQKCEARFHVSTANITAVVQLGIWTLALLLFVIFWMIDKPVWLFFIAALPVSLIAMLVLNVLWFDRRANQYIVAALVLSLFLLVYYIFRAYTPWKIFLLLAPAEAIVFLSHHILKRKK